MQPKVYSTGEGYRDEREWKVCWRNGRNRAWGWRHASADSTRHRQRQRNIAGTHLVLPVAAQKVLGHVGGQDVLQQDPVEVLHGFDLLALPLELVPPQEVQPAVILVLLQEDTE